MYDERLFLIDPVTIRERPDAVTDAIRAILTDEGNQAGMTRATFSAGLSRFVVLSETGPDRFIDDVFDASRRIGEARNPPNIPTVNLHLRDHLDGRPDRVHIVWIGGRWSLDNMDPLRSQIDQSCMQRYRDQRFSGAATLDLEIHPIASRHLPSDNAVEVLLATLFDVDELRFLGFVAPGCSTLDWALFGDVTAPTITAARSNSTCAPDALPDLPAAERFRDLPYCNPFASRTMSRSQIDNAPFMQMIAGPDQGYRAKVLVKPEGGPTLELSEAATGLQPAALQRPGPADLVLELTPTESCRPERDDDYHLTLLVSAQHFRPHGRLEVSVTGLDCGREDRSPFFVHLSELEIT